MTTDYLFHREKRLDMKAGILLTLGQNRKEAVIL
jgi:hypothetical protein